MNFNAEKVAQSAHGAVGRSIDAVEIAIELRAVDTQPSTHLGGGLVVAAQQPQVVAKIVVHGRPHS